VRILGRIAISIVVVAPVLVAQTPTPAPGRGVIVGQVIDAVTGEPILDAIVTLGASSAGGPSALASASAQRVFVDDRGRFAFTGLARGAYAIAASRAGYADGGYGRTKPSGLPSELNLADGAHATDLKIRMWKLATVSGTVLDEAGDPVVGVTVRALQRTFNAGRPRFTAVGVTSASVTDDRGTYRLSELVPGDYLIAVPSVETTIPVAVLDQVLAGPSDAQREIQAELFKATSSFSSQSSPQNQRIGDLILQVQGRVVTPPPVSANGRLAVYPTVFYPSASRLADASLVTLSAGDDRSGLDFHLEPEPSVRVSGTLMGPDGPVKHTAVRLVPPGADALVSDVGPATATAISDAHGAFTLLGVPAGQYEVRAVKVPPPGQAPASGTVIQVGAGATIAPTTGPPPRPSISSSPPTLWAADPLIVGTSDVDNLVVTLRVGARVSGTLVFDGTAPKPDAATLAQGRVTLYPSDGHDTGVDDGQINADGTFMTYGVPPGRYYVVGAQPTGYTLTSITVDGRDVTNVPLEVKDADVTGVILGFTDHPSSLSGTVRMAEGPPDPEASVLVFPTDAREWQTFEARSRFAVRRAGATGAFTILGLPAGDYFVIAMPDASAPGYGDSRAFATLSQSATRITLGKGEVRMLDLRTVRK